MDLFETGDQPVIDDSKSYYPELVGEGKRYKDNEALAKKAVHADATIEILKRQLDTMREDYTAQAAELNSRAQLQDVLDQLKRTETPYAPPEAPEKQQPAFDPEQVRKMIQDSIQESETSKIHRANEQSFREKLVEKYGQNFQVRLQEQMDNLGLSKELVQSLARTNPNVLVKTLGLDQQTQPDSFQAPPRSDRRSDSFAPSAQKRTWSYYQNLRKENPNLYNSPKINLQMIEDYKALGDAFEDGDFNRR